MDQWEYLPMFIEANAKDKDIREYLKARMPEVKKPPRYTPESMMPRLNELGAQGWELIHMEPVAGVGSKGDVLFENNGRQWSNVYFCVFKRRRQAQMQPQTTRGEYAALPVEEPVYQLPNNPLPPDPPDPEAD
ncbi:MAG: hypothetical protein ACOCX5_02450 [Chloroflexota bacterium]